MVKNGSEVYYGNGLDSYVGLKLRLIGSIEASSGLNLYDLFEDHVKPIHSCNMSLKTCLYSIIENDLCDSGKQAYSYVLHYSNNGFLFSSIGASNYGILSLYFGFVRT